MPHRLQHLNVTVPGFSALYSNVAGLSFSSLMQLSLTASISKPCSRSRAVILKRTRVPAGTSTVLGENSYLLAVISTSLTFCGGVAGRKHTAKKNAATTGMTRYLIRLSSSHWHCVSSSTGESAKTRERAESLHSGHP